MALRLFFPKAQLACLDAGVEGPDNLAGMEQPDRPSAIELGRSPQDTPRVVESHLDGCINLAFIDGLHTNEQQLADYLSLRPYLDTDHVVLFHDVRFCGMRASLATIAQAQHAAILSRTTSGIGMVFSESMAYRMGRVSALFGGQPVTA